MRCLLFDAQVNTRYFQVSTVRFASTPTIAIPFAKNRPKDEIIQKIGEIEFTGTNTRIADAVDLAIAELTRSRRHDATQVRYYYDYCLGHLLQRSKEEDVSSITHYFGTIVLQLDGCTIS